MVIWPIRAVIGITQRGRRRSESWVDLGKRANVLQQPDTLETLRASLRGCGKSSLVFPGLSDATQAKPEFLPWRS
jgi:hypothetical protein